MLDRVCRFLFVLSCRNWCVSVHRQILNSWSYFWIEEKIVIFPFVVSVLMSLNTYEQPLSLVIIVVTLVVDLVNDETTECLFYDVSSFNEARERKHFHIDVRQLTMSKKETLFTKINLMMTFDGMEWRRECVPYFSE